MSELTTGGINFGYQSPINIYQMIDEETQNIIKEIHTQEENTVIAEITRKMGVDVDKQELIKALNYDRNQYEKGYSDGRASIVEELKNQKTGHWIEKNVNQDGIHNIYCSNCNNYLKFKGHANSYNARTKLKYCPNCGAKMEGENNE